MTVAVPTGFRVHPGNGRVRATWTPPDLSAVNGVPRYDVAHQPLDGDADAVVERMGVTSPLVVSGLTNLLDYEFRVRAADLDGESDWSAGVECRPHDGVLLADPSLALHKLIEQHITNIPRFELLGPDESFLEYGERSATTCRFQNNGGAQWGTRNTRVGLRRRVDCYTYAPHRSFARYLDERISGYLSSRGAGAVAIMRRNYESRWEFAEDAPLIEDRVMVYDCRAQSPHDTYDPSLGGQRYPIVLRSYQVWIAPYYLDSEPFLAVGAP